MTVNHRYANLRTMNSQVNEHKDVHLIAHGDKIITRVIVSVDGDVYFVCKREEFEQAKKEGRDPVCVGFKREYVLNQ